MAKILIKNGRIWNGEQFICGDVLTEGKYITRIDEHIDCDAEYVFDASGKIVSAGLIDIHVHMKGIASDVFGVQAEMSSFPFGVTAVNDAGSSCGDKALLDSFTVKNTVFVCVHIRDNHACLDMTEKLLEKYGDKAIGVKAYFDTNVSEVRDITPLKEVCNYAKNKNLKVMVHCSNSPTSMVDIINVLSTGDILTHIFHGGKNTCMDNEYETFKATKKKGVIMDAGFAGHVHTNFKILESAIKSGYLPDTISTDITRLSAYVRGGRYGMTMCMNIAKKAGMCETDIFKAVTSTPAKALGKENEWGYLEVGRIADIAVFDYTNEGFNLTDREGNSIQSSVGYRCVLTVTDGQIIYRD